MVNKLKIYFRILLYLSILFVVYYLYKFDFLSLSELKIDIPFTLLSVLMLWIGFYLSTNSWRVSLNAHGFNISSKEAIYSHGISVFAKYMPGKIWVILGRASIISEKGLPLMQLATISLREQLLYLLLGLIISLVALPFLSVSIWFSILVILGVFALGLFLFSQWVHEKVTYLFLKLFKKELNIPFIPMNDALPMVLAIMSYWVFWGLGFYFLVRAVSPDAGFLVAFAFPMSVSCGLLAIFMPGGIGVREGIIVMFLTSIGHNPALAVTISIIQRLWFISGEVFIFGAAFISKRLTVHD
jgi:hypothetical protein